MIILMIIIVDWWAIKASEQRDDEYNDCDVWY